MSTFQSFYKKAGQILARLSSKPLLGGIYVSNFGIQYISFIGGVPKMISLRFPPGVVTDGRIQDKEQFRRVCSEIHAAVSPDNPDKRTQVVVVLPGALVYTQSFSIPNVGDDKIDESAILNLQMISPIPQQTAYMSWQELGGSSDKRELLGAFVERSAVDEIRDIFSETGFYPIAFEFPSLSLSRLVSESSDIKEKCVLMFHISSDGINLAIIRGNKLHFDYFRSWRSIQGEESQISRERFDRVIVEEVRKVMNFSMSKFRVKVDMALIVAPGFESEVSGVISKNFSMEVDPLTLSVPEISPQWYVAYGAAMREAMYFGSKERYINLNKETSEDLFFQEHLFGFVGLWRNAITVVFGFFLFVFAVAYLFLSGQEKTLQSGIVLSKAEVNQSEYSLIAEKAGRFNVLLEVVGREPENADFWHGFLTGFIDNAAGNKISVRRVDASSVTSPIQIYAEAPDNASVVAFKNKLSESAEYGERGESYKDKQA